MASSGYLFLTLVLALGAILGAVLGAKTLAVLTICVLLGFAITIYVQYIVNDDYRETRLIMYIIGFPFLFSVWTVHAIKYFLF